MTCSGVEASFSSVVDNSISDASNAALFSQERDMPERIARLQAQGLSISNGILQAPGGETLFLFEGEI